MTDQEVDWDAEAEAWRDDTLEWVEDVRDYVSTLWAEDWDSAEDGIYDQ